MRWFSAAKWGCWLLVAGWFLGSVTPALAQRPAAPKILPENTLLYFRITDSKVLIERFQQTAMGRIGQDEEIRPLVSQLYGSVAEIFAKLEDEVGQPLDKILALPQGEICLALVVPDAGRPELLFLFEAGDQLPAVQKMLDKGLEAAQKDGFRVETEVVGDVKFTNLIKSENEHFTFFEKDGLLVVGTNADQPKQLLKLWEGTADAEVKTLADNRKFTTIMNRCLGSKDDPPQFTWFVDPIATVKAFGRGNFAAQAGLAVLPVLGLDGFQAVGGSLIMATGEFDSISHLHVLLDEPRSGVLEALAFKSGDATPEPWVPVDASSYMTFNFDVEQSHAAITKVYDSMYSDGAFAKVIRSGIDEPLGVDFENEIMTACAGRFTMFTWVKKPAERLTGQAVVFGVQLSNPKEFQKIFDRLTDKHSDKMEKQLYGLTPYWRMKVPEPMAAAETPPAAEEPAGREGRRRRRGMQLDIPPPRICFAIIDDYLLISDRPSAMEQAIITSTDPEKALASDLEFKLIMGKLRRQPGGANPAMISFNRPEEQMRLLYDVANAERTRKFLESRDENERFLRGVDKALKDNPLPPFAVLAKYLAPGGGLMVSDETGFHISSYQLRRK